MSVRLTARTVLDEFLPYLAQMITSMRGYVAHNDLWPWPISSRLFSCDIAYFMDCIHIWHKHNPWVAAAARRIWCTSDMGSVKCKIEWNGNFEATYLMNCLDLQHELWNTNLKKMFESACKKLVLTQKYCVTEHCVNMAPWHVHTGEKLHD